MDPASLALALVSAQQGQFQAAVATQVLKSQATQDAGVLQILNAGNPLANVAPGIGQPRVSAQLRGQGVDPITNCDVSYSLP